MNLRARKAASVLALLAGCGSDTTGGGGAPDSGATGAADSGTPAADAATPQPDASLDGGPIAGNCIPPTHPVACVWSSDWDLDGEADTRESNEFDVQGRIITSSYDSDADGEIEQIDAFTYDGDALVMEVLTNWLGETVRRRTYSYDAAGLLVEESRDEGGDGTIDLRHTYERNSAGALASWTVERGGAWDQTFTFVYEMGRLVEIEVSRKPEDGIDDLDTFMYDTAGRVTQVELDMQANDSPDKTMRHGYDESGREVFFGYGDPYYREVLVASYESMCSPSMYIVDQYLAGLDWRVLWSYDEAGDLTQIDWDSDFDGETDFRHSFDYSCNPPPLTGTTAYPQRLSGPMPRVPEFPEYGGEWTPIAVRMRPPTEMLHDPTRY